MLQFRYGSLVRGKVGKASPAAGPTTAVRAVQVETRNIGCALVDGEVVFNFLPRMIEVSRPLSSIAVLLFAFGILAFRNGAGVYLI